MPQAVIEPEEVRRFARNLNRFADEVEGQLTLLKAQMTSLSSSWRDQEQERFSEEFEQTTRQLSRFIEATRTHIPFLLRKAQRAQDYLDQR